MQLIAETDPTPSNAPATGALSPRTHIGGPAGAPTTRSGSRLARTYGPWSVVTGASSGIGLACARELARQGLSVVLVARGAHTLAAAAEELERDHGVSTRVLSCDLGTEDGVERLLDATFDLDIGLLVASAGFGSSGAFLESEVDVETAMLALNAGAVLRLSHAFGRRFRDRGRGGIVLMSSVVAFQGTPHSANYAATKAYVQTLAEGLGAELAPHGVDVLASAPGPTRSGFATRASMTMGSAATPETVARGTLRALGRRRTVRPGALSKLLGWSLAVLPRSQRVRVMARVMRGMTEGPA